MKGKFADIRRIPTPPAIEVEFDLEETCEWLKQMNLGLAERLIPQIRDKKALAPSGWVEAQYKNVGATPKSLVNGVETGFCGPYEEVIHHLAYHSYGVETLFFTDVEKEVKVVMNSVIGLCFGAPTIPRREVIVAEARGTHSYPAAVLGIQAPRNLVKAHYRGTMSLTPPCVPYLKFVQSLEI